MSRLLDHLDRDVRVVRLCARALAWLPGRSRRVAGQVFLRSYFGAEPARLSDLLPGLLPGAVLGLITGEERNAA